MTMDPGRDTEPRRMRITVLPRRLWLIASWRWTRPGARFLTLDVQRRLAWPPALIQTRHYSVMVSEAHDLTVERQDA